MTVRSRLGYQPSLDGIRGYGVVTIVLFHAFEFPTGAFIALDVFFVLSGFLITTLLLEEWVKRDTISLKAFYMRRFLRLFPAMFVLLASFVALAAVQSSLTTLRLKSAVASLFYASNIVQAAELPFDLPSLGHLWSLALEEQFYIMWPSVLVLALTRWPKKIPQIALAGITLVFVWRLVLTLQDASFARLYYPPDVRFDEFLVGCLGGSLFVQHRDFLTSIPSRVYAWATGIAVGLMGVGVFVMPAPEVDTRAMSLGGYTVVAFLALVLIIACVLDRAKPVQRVLSVNVIVFLGKVSYSVYLWHFALNFLTRNWVLFDSLRITRFIQVGLSFAAGIGSYFLVERPFLKLKERFSKRPPQLPAEGPGRLPFEMEPEGGEARARRGSD